MLHGQPRVWNDVDLALRQLAAVQQWLHAARMSGSDPAEADRQRRALVARAHQQLSHAGGPLRPRLPRRLVLGHRNEWFVSTLQAALAGTELILVCHVPDADEVIGCVVAEQPDVLLVESQLPGMQRTGLLHDVLKYSPHCAIVVQVQDAAEVGRLLDAGAGFACHRQVPPREVAQQLVQLANPHVPRLLSA